MSLKYIVFHKLTLTLPIVNNDFLYQKYLEGQSVSSLFFLLFPSVFSSYFHFQEQRKVLRFFSESEKIRKVFSQESISSPTKDLSKIFIDKVVTC